jgi:hypothetical protein
MFGQHDWQGRMVSFLVRLFNVIVRSFGMAVFLCLMVAVFFLWIIFPVFVTYMLIQSLGF